MGNWVLRFRVTETRVTIHEVVSNADPDGADMELVNEYCVDKYGVGDTVEAEVVESDTEIEYLDARYDGYGGEE